MRPPEGERLDAAVDLFHDHAWRGAKPVLSVEQIAELLPVWAEWYREELAPRKARVQRMAKPRMPEVSASSSNIPSAIRSAVIKRDGWSCQRCGRNLFDTVRYGLQHRRPRQMGGSKRLHTMANLVALCGWSVDEGTCTAWVEVEDRPGATRDGWLVPLGGDPEEWPVLRYGTSWEQPGVGWEKTSPHERQIELGALEVA